MIPHFTTVIIEKLTPLVDDGRYPIKRAIGQNLSVEADIYMAGHDIVSALLKWRKTGAKTWLETPMQPIPNGQDRHCGTCTLFENAIHDYTIEAWIDAFFSWQHEFRKKVQGGLKDLTSETIEGAHLVEQAAVRAGDSPEAKLLRELAKKIAKSAPAEVDRIAHLGELEGLMSAYPDRSQTTEFALPSAGDDRRYPSVAVDRERAIYAAWYEFFPRSAEGRANKASTFRDCLPRIDDAKAMGFDVIYFPPIHPIGHSNRKGRNNATKCEPGEPGVPYAIGNHRLGINGGGHKDIEPALGNFKDFDWLIKELAKRKMELALDFAINCSPDHPYVRDHPEWFFKRPDGTIKYAENPPKKYEDVYPLNFFCHNWLELWEELTSVVMFWAEKKVRIFRVDNPHTKPVAFWEYLIAKVRAKFPDTIFLSEAFTRPKMMKLLTKAGFQQSYTYFTWRDRKAELEEYFTELTQTEMAEYFTGNLFPNTPDILPVFLQQGGRPAFMIRAVLAATLSSVYGIYSGFELCENAALPNREEYLDSEKYQLKERDWNALGNIKDYLTRINRIRRENRALHQYANLRFFHAENPNVLFYGKTTEALDNIMLVVVNLDPHQAHDSFLDVPMERFGLSENDTYQVHDLLSDERYVWRGRRNFVSLDPNKKPAHIFRLRRWAGREQGADLYA